MFISNVVCRVSSSSGQLNDATALGLLSMNFTEVKALISRLMVLVNNNSPPVGRIANKISNQCRIILTYQSFYIVPFVSRNLINPWLDGITTPHLYKSFPQKQVEM